MQRRTFGINAVRSFAVCMAIASTLLHAAKTVPPNLGGGLDSIYAAYLRNSGAIAEGALSSSEFDAAEAYLDSAIQDSSGRIRVLVYLNSTKSLDAVRAALKSSGKFVVEGQSASYRAGVIDGWVDIADVGTIANTPGVQSVVLVTEAITEVGRTTQKAVVQHRVNQITAPIAAPGVDGTGITIGVLSNSYDRLPADAPSPAPPRIRAANDIASGDLPGVGNPLGNLEPVVVLQDSVNTATDEGRAMLQLIHDVAPKARLGFAAGTGSQLQFAENIRSLAALPGAVRSVPGFSADVIVDDILFPNEPMFSDGLIAQAVNDVTAAGKHYFASFGNRPSSLAYAGTFNQVGPGGAPTAGSNINLERVPPELYAGGFHNFRTDGGQDIAQTLRRFTGTGDILARLELQWDDPFDKVTPGTQIFSAVSAITATTPSLDFSIPLRAGVPTRVVVAANGNTFDAVVTIRDSLGNIVIDKRDDLTDETIYFTPAQTGNYTVTVTAFGTRIGEFTLSAFENSTLGVTTEYNLLFFNADTGAFISATRSRALIRNQPRAGAAVIPFPPTANTIQVVIARSAGNTANRLRYVLFAGDTTIRPDEYVSYQYPSGYGHNSAANAHGVAAVRPFRPYIPEDFSASGPVTIVFDAEGNRLAAPEIRQQPTLAATDGANNTFFGTDSVNDADSFPNFFGTSAAAPTAAAMAALVLQAKGGPGSLTVPQMKSILTGTTFANDLDPYRSQAVVNVTGASAGTLTITADADYTDSSAATPTLPVIDRNVFRVSYTGTGSVASITLDGTNGNTTGGNETIAAARPGIVFDTRAVASGGLPATFGLFNGLTRSDITVVPGSTAAPAPAVAGQSFAFRLNFSANRFTTGRSFGFNVDRDELITSSIPNPPTRVASATDGNSADLFGANVSYPEGTVATGGVGVTVTMTDGTTASGVFVNSIGAGYSRLTGFGAINAEAAVAAPVPPSASDAPIITLATAGNGQISVAFNPPAATGGSAIIDYTVRCGTASQTGTSSPILVTGLTNGTTYTCTVTARNTTGSSVRSAPSNAVTPMASTTTTSLTGPATSTAGESVTFTATVTGTSSPTGTVIFNDGTTTITGCSAVALAGTAATCTTNALPVGSRSLTAMYVGDASNLPSTSSILLHTVNTAFVTLTVSKTGVGSVGSEPSGIACGVDCSESYAKGTTVSLVAVPEAGSVFAGWSAGAETATCAGLGNCTLTLNASTNVTATFVPLITYNLVLEGIQEVPRRATPAIGSGTVVVNTVANTLTYNVSYSGLLGTLTVAHFHGPANRDAGAGAKIDITASPNSGTVTYLEADEADILAGRWYYNLHSTAFPAGELRGQLDNQGAACGLDVDVDGNAGALTDGLLMLRYLKGARGTDLVAGLLNPPASLRTDPAVLETVIERMIAAKRLDFDGDGVTGASTDGLVLLRALLGFTETAVTDNALGTGTLARPDWTAIRAYLVGTCKLTLP